MKRASPCWSGPRLYGGGFLGDGNGSPGADADRVGFPKDYREKFTVLRRVNRPEKKQVVTVYGNEPAASIKRPADLPYPYGSILVMETAGARKDAEDKTLLDGEGYYRKDQVVGLHVMRRENGFGEAYGKNRTGEWEYVEYRADQTYITPPQKSFAWQSATSRRGENDFVTGEGFRPPQGRNEVPEHGTDSILGLPLTALCLFLAFWVPAEFLRKAGFSRWIALIIPLTGFVGLAIFAFIEWPVEREWPGCAGSRLSPRPIPSHRSNDTLSNGAARRMEEGRQIYMELAQRVPADENGEYYQNCAKRPKEHLDA